MQKEELCDMQKKKILIAAHFMHPGGVERALLGLLQGIDHSRYEVFLFLFRHEGALLSFLPEEVTLLPQIASYAQLACPFCSVLRKGYVRLAFARIRGRLAADHYRRRYSGDCSQVELTCSHRYTRRWMPQITPDVEYDLAISFLTPHYFVAEKVRAKTKAAWVHTDYSSVQTEDAEEMMWDAYDRIAAVSESCRQALIRRFPGLEEKTECVENLLPADLIRAQAKEVPEHMNRYERSLLSHQRAAGRRCAYGQDQTDARQKLLSVGRFCPAKNFTLVPELCRRIREQGVDVVWYLIGYGSEETLIRQKIKEERMEAYVILLGKKENPYPYLAACDWYVQPSRYEGKSVSVKEAQFLHKPVIITAYPTAKSQLLDGYDGKIVPLEPESCSRAMAAILTDDSLKERLIRNTCRHSDPETAELQKIYAWMEI